LETLLAKVVTRAPLREVTDDLGIVNEVRAIDDPAEIAIVQRALADARVLIADGHHRYETALEYRRRRRVEDGNSPGTRPYDYVMMTLVAFNDPGLVILPTHRLVRRLPAAALESFQTRAAEIFDLREVSSVDAMRTAIGEHGSGTIGVVLKGRAPLRVLRLRDRSAIATAMPDVQPAVRELDVSILHTLVLDRIFGIKPEEVRQGGNIDCGLGRSRRCIHDGIANRPRCRARVQYRSNDAGKVHVLLSQVADRARDESARRRPRDRRNAGGRRQKLKTHASPAQGRLDAHAFALLRQHATVGGAGVGKG
jgi:hypothetical protein